MEKIFLNKKILLTRSLKESQEFEKSLLRANFSGEVVISPLLEIDHMEPKLILEKYDVLIATSIHALRKYRTSLKDHSFTVFSVGKRINDFLSTLGVKKSFNSENVSDLLLSLEKFLQRKKYKTIYLRGKNISRDITKHLRKLGHEIEEKIVYKQRMTKAHGEIQKILNDRNLVGIAMFSEKSVEFLVENCSSIPIDKIFFCFSKKIEKKVKYLINERIKCITTSRPIINNMAEMIVAKFPK